MNSTLNRVICIVAAQLVFATLAQSVSAQETAEGLLAIQARAQGYRCDKPISAKRDAKRSKPDVAFWESGGDRLVHRFNQNRGNPEHPLLGVFRCPAT
ncbi:MAG TPA: hypothetical protein VI137_02830 [Pseudolabrys sp.]|jgi:hypothetical protein